MSRAVDVTTSASSFAVAPRYRDGAATPLPRPPEKHKQYYDYRNTIRWVSVALTRAAAVPPTTMR
jgi:hypothetical protein